MEGMREALARDAHEQGRSSLRVARQKTESAIKALDDATDPEEAAGLTPMLL
jgi:hypothetical protein